MSTTRSWLRAAFAAVVVWAFGVALTLLVLVALGWLLVLAAIAVVRFR